MTNRPRRAGRRYRARWLLALSFATLATVALCTLVTPRCAAAEPPLPPDRRCSPPAYGLWRIWNWHEDATWQLSADRPRAVEVSNTRERPGPGALTISAEIAKCPPGATATVTLSLVDDVGTVSECPLPLTSRRGRQTGTLMIPDFGGQVKRVVATAWLAGSAGSARCRLSVGFIPAAAVSPKASGPATSAATVPDAASPAAVAAETPLVSPPSLPAPLIEVKRVTRETSSRVEDRTYHALWLWSFGDGIAYPDADPENVISTQVHPFVTPGMYTVTARSISNKGTLLRELSWPVIVLPPPPGAPPVPLVRVFSAETIREPSVRLRLDGPHKWVVGRPADFVVTVDFADPPYANRESVLIDPGREFTVVWDKPGHFTTRAAAVIHLRYEFPERVVSIVNTYVIEQAVEVFATVSTD